MLGSLVVSLFIYWLDVIFLEFWYRIMTNIPTIVTPLTTEIRMALNIKPLSPTIVDIAFRSVPLQPIHKVMF